MRESIPKKVDKKSRVPKEERKNISVYIALS